MAFKGDAYNLFAKPGNQINLSRITGISFWVRAARDTYIEQIGLGRDRQSSDSAYHIELKDTVVGTEWQRVIIPIPGPKFVFVDEVFYIYRAYADLWIDDIEFITNTITNMTIIMPDLEPINGYPTSTPVSRLLKGVKFEYTFEGIDEKGYISEGFSFTPWYGATYSYAVTGDAVVQGTHNHIYPQAGGTSYTLSVSLMGESNSGIGVITELRDWIFDDFISDTRSGDYWFWGAGWWDGFEAMREFGGIGKPGATVGLNQQWMGMGRRSESWNFSPFTKISFYFGIQLDEDELAREGIQPWYSDYWFGLETDDGTPYFAPAIRVSANNKWEEFVFNLDEFIEDGGTAKLTDVGVSQIAGYVLRYAVPRAPWGKGEWPKLAEIKAVVK
jgi:hypothetical protein